MRQTGQSMNQQNFDKIPLPPKPEKESVQESSKVLENERSVFNITPTDVKNLIKFFPIDSFPVETLALLNGKCESYENECKKEVKLYVSATFTG